MWKPIKQKGTAISTNMGMHINTSTERNKTYKLNTIFGTACQKN